MKQKKKKNKDRKKQKGGTRYSEGMAADRFC